MMLFFLQAKASLRKMRLFACASCRRLNWYDPHVIGLIEGIAEATASLLKMASGWLSDRLGRRKWLAVLGYAVSTISKPFLILCKLGEPRAKSSKYPEPDDPALKRAHLRADAPALRLTPYALRLTGAGAGEKGGAAERRRKILEKIGGSNGSK